MFATPAYAQAAGAAGGGASILGSPIIMMVLIFVIFYFLLIRPQQKRAKEHAAMIKALRRGDQIVTAGGLVAKVTKVGADDENEIEAEIAQGVKVKLIRSTISVVMSKTEPANDK
jgi:preprotein translocase subunit YajC